MSGQGFLGLFGGPKLPPIPQPQPVVRMPDYNSPEALEERRLRLSQLQQNQGRESTILTGSANPNYSNKRLGQ